MSLPANKNIISGKQKYHLRQKRLAAPGIKNIIPWPIETRPKPC
jgi:hypothetical protein